MPCRRGFTLVELLVTTSIIVLLASMLIFGLARVQSRAQRTKTKATVTRLHSLLSRRWNSYATRRVPVDTRGLAPSVAAELRLVALRQLMRLEMPERWLDVTTAPAQLTRIDGTAFSQAPPLMTRPALSEAYLRYYNTVSIGKPGAVSDKPSSKFQTAECLYMVITLGAMDEGTGRELFTDADISDVDNDGAPEFVDAWGMPISFIRWPVGFVDLDPVDEATKKFGHLSDLMPRKAASTAGQNPCLPDASGNNHDPFDPRRVDAKAFVIYPLIYSAGPDRIPDIVNIKVSGGNEVPASDDPYRDVRADGCGEWLGSPKDLDSYRYATTNNPNGVLNQYDNIHNHQFDSTTK